MKQVLVTGFPGFVAGYLVPELVRRADRVHLLVEERFREKAEREAAGIGPNCAVVAGDITAPDLGLAGPDLDRLRAEVDTVFHLAAVYDLGMSRELGLRVNVGGTERVNEFVRRLESLEAYNYISTCYVVGEVEGRVTEDELPQGQRFRNFYEETKHLAEVPVRAMIGELPVRIFRPTVIVGDSRTGFTVKYDGPYMVMKALQTLPGPLGRINSGTEHTLNIVPIDFVARAMAEISANPDSVGRTFHLADPAPLSTRRISDVFCRLLTGQETWLALPEWLVRPLAGTPIVSWLYGIPRGAAPYFYGKVEFDCANTLRFLEGTGIACPRLEDYAENLVRYFLAHPTPGEPVS